MGFKCPVCLKDFKRDKEEWQKHCAEEHEGAGKEIVAFVTDVVEEHN